MKRNKKLLALALSVTFVMALAVTVISYTFANLGQSQNDSGVMLLADGDDNVATAKTNIDYIIEGTKAADSEPYKVVEVGSKNISAATAFANFVKQANTDGTAISNFVTYVINGNKTITQEMAAGRIQYTYVYGGITEDNAGHDDAVAAVAGADFIYVSATEQAYTKGNDFSEDMYNALHVAAIGDYKPFIIDKPSSAGSSDVIEGKKQFTDIVDDYFSEMGHNYAAYYWGYVPNTSTKLDATAFYSGGIGSGSYYVALSGNARSSYWTTIVDPADSAATKNMAEILVITGDVAPDTTSDAVENFAFTGATPQAYTSVTNKKDSSVIDVTGNKTLYSIKDSPIYTYGYSKRYASKPDYMLATRVTLGELEADADFDFTKYDMVLFENSCGTVEVSDTLFKNMVALMYSNKHIVYSKSISSGSASGGGGTTADETTNYYELYSMLATEDDIEKYPNVMSTDRKEMDIIMSSNSAETCKAIADIINAAAFRGIGGPASTSTAFTVLEIQPCYPIDEQIAAVKGDYYTKPSEVINGKTKEQLGIEVNADGTANATTNTQEYYDWEITEAKVADALGMDAKQVKVVHMSSEEFATNKEVVLGNYDLVYIGGNTSALDSIMDWRSVPGLHGNYSVSNAVASQITKLPAYTMYTHTGDMVNLRVAGGEGPVTSGTPIVIAQGKTADTTFVTLNGNDITYTGYENLVDYVDAGMPVIISNKVTSAYDFIAGERVAGRNPYLQNSIDPDSYMCKFLDYCYEEHNNETTRKNKVTNIQYGFDIDTIALVDNNGGKLGNTLTGYVEVFGDSEDSTITTDPRDVFKSIYKSANKRPKLAVTSMPAIYNVYDKTSKTESRTLDYKFEVTGSTNYTVNLYADYNKNSLFESSDKLATANGGTSISVNLSSKAEYGDNYSGPVYWKLEIVDKDTGAAVSTTQLAYVASKSNKKTEVNVLHILPDDTLPGTTGGNNWISLYFCTECQRAQRILQRNPGYEGSLFEGTNNLYAAKLHDGYLSSTGTFRGIYTGLHEHQFGVVRYDSATGMDDWNYNFANDVSDIYDFSMDVMDSRTFEETNAQVQKDLTDYLASYYSGKTLETMTAEEIEAMKMDLSLQASLAKQQLVAYEEGALATAEAELRTFIESVKDSGPQKYNDVFNAIYDSRMYQDYVLYLSQADEQNPNPNWHYADYKKYYEAYAHARDEKIELENVYKQANRLANYENWLDCYSTVIIGPAESFCADDINDQAALDTLTDYIENGGHMLLFHDTLTRYSDTGAHNLTYALLDYYGMDKNHAEVNDTLEILKSGNVSINVNGKDYNFEGVNFACDGATLKLDLNNQWTWFEHKVINGTVVGNEPHDFNLKLQVYNGSNSTLAPNTSVTVTYGTEVYTGTTDANGEVAFVTSNTALVAESAMYMPYKLKDGYSSPEYTLPNLSFRTDDSKYSLWYSDMQAVYGNLSQINGQRFYSPTYAFTDAINLGHNDNQAASPYKYATTNWHANTMNGYDPTKATDLGSNKASKTNKGIVTLYPFSLSDELNLSPTHPQAFALDLQNKDLSVWYTLAGGTNRTGSELQAATPHDGTDNYFIYTVGNLNYCAAGHCKITGPGKDNNDERMLYINIICNSVINIPQTEIEAFDYNTENNNIVKVNGDEYIYKLEEDDVIPEFSFKYTLGKDATMQQVNVYFDIDENGMFTSEQDILNTYFDGKAKAALTAEELALFNTYRIDRYIKQYTSATIKENELTNIPAGEKGSVVYNADELNLKIDPSYLTNGKYVYIIIEVIDTKGNVTIKKIKVEYKDILYNLT